MYKRIGLSVNTIIGVLGPDESTGALTSHEVRGPISTISTIVIFSTIFLWKDYPKVPVSSIILWDLEPSKRYSVWLVVDRFYPSTLGLWLWPNSKVLVYLAIEDYWYVKHRRIFIIHLRHTYYWTGGYILYIWSSI